MGAARLPRVPRVIVCLGAGGVGKTSSAAAIAIACAEAGLATLAVTLDPARRLAEALEGHLGGPLLQVFEPEARHETQALVRSLLDAATRKRLERNRIYLAVADALAGMEDLASVAGLGSEVARRDVDVVVVDTAPSRHAIRAIGLAGRVLALVDSKVLVNIARLFGRPSARGLGARLLSFASQPVARVLEGALGRGPVDEVIELIEVLIGTRSRLAEIARAADALLANADTRFVVVTSPADNALATALHLAADLGRGGRRPDAFVINRAAPDAPAWLAVLQGSDSLPTALQEVVGQLGDEGAAQRLATTRAKQTIARAWPSTPVWLHHEQDAPPQVVVAGLRRGLAALTQGLLAGLPRTALAQRPSTKRSAASSVG